MPLLDEESSCNYRLTETTTEGYGTERVFRCEDYRDYTDCLSGFNSGDVLPASCDKFGLPETTKNHVFECENVSTFLYCRTGFENGDVTPVSCDKFGLWISYPNEYER